jgi:ribosome-binding factor A
MVSKTRAVRIGERIREDLTEIIQLQVNDPRILGVSITDVTVDRELAYAEIFVSALEGVARSQELLDGLERAQGFLRTELAKRIELRRFPRLRFHWDPTSERAERIEKLISQIQHDQPEIDSGKAGIADE